MNNTFYIDSPYLQHYGVLGMKWGVRRYQNKDGTLTAAGRKHYSLNKQKYGIEPAAAIVLGLLSVVTVAEISREALVAKDFVDTIIAENKGKKIDKLIAENNVIDEKTGIKLKQKEMTKDEDMKIINPLYKTKIPGARENCVICSVCYDLRQRGYDVTANLRHQGYGLTDDQILKIYPGSKIEWLAGPKIFDPTNKHTNLSKQEVKDVTNKIIKQQGEGARGQVLIRFVKNGRVGGHSMAYDIENNKLVIRDCQSCKKYSPEQILTKAITVEILRTDNLEPDYKIAKECIKGNEWVEFKKI